MSLKSLGSVAKVAKEINNLSTKQRKRNGSNAARSVFDSITSSDTPESLIKQWTSAGMSKDAVYDMLTHAGRSEKIQGFSEKEAKQEASRCLRCDHFGYGIFKGGRETLW